MTIGVTLATIESRKDSVLKTIESLHKALRIYQYTIYVQADYPKPDGITNVRWNNIGNHKGDARKFHPITMPHKYWIICDDDLLYPFDYIATSLKHIRRNPNAVLSYHGRTVKKPPLDMPECSYYRRSRKEGFRCLGTVDGYNKIYPNDFNDGRLGTLGTGVMFFKSGTVNINWDDFKHPNMADIWLAKFAIEQKVPMIVCPHKEGWITPIPNNGGIFEKHQWKDEIQTQVYNSIKI